MFINSKRFFSYFVSLIFLSILILNIPLPQPAKYIIFICINFCLIIFSNKKKLFFLQLRTIFSIFFFIFVLILINILEISFKIKVQSFGNISFENLSPEALSFYKSDYLACLENYLECYGDSIEDIEITNEFKRNYLNISNINELRSNIFTSPGTTYQDNNNKYLNKKNYPYLIHLEFPKIYKGSKICYFENQITKKCLLIDNTKKSYEIVGKGEASKIFLKQNLYILLLKYLLSFIFLISYVFFLKQLYYFNFRDKFESLYPISLILILAIISFTNIENINFLNSYFYQYPGGDGYLYLFQANIIAESFKNFNFIEFLRGDKDIFYHMPGMRYFVGIEKILFGNAYYLHLIVLTFLPFILRKLFLIYFSNKVSNILMFLFLLFPLMHHMGFSYFQYFRYFTKVFAEPIAYTIFILALVRVIYFYNKPFFFKNSLPFSCFLLTSSCILRPNLSSSSFFLLLFPFYYLIKEKNYKILVFFILAGSTIFLPLFHNLYFGKKFVLFTGAVFTDANIKINLSDYIQLLTSFEISNVKKIMMIEMFKNFFNPYEIHKYFIILGVIVSLRITNLKSKILIPIYIVIFSQFFLFFFLNPGPRYMWIFWLCALVLSLHTFIEMRQKNI